MKRWFKSLAGTFLAATIIALLVRLFVIEDLRIGSDSMYPTLYSGDLVFVTKFTFNLHLPFSTYELVKFRAPLHSEVVAFSLPDRGMETFVKRVVAIEGDRVAIEKGFLIINGNKVKYSPNETLQWEEPAGAAKYPVQLGKQEAMKDYGPVDIPPGHFFALGDNRVESNDSRTWGPIPYSCLKGRVALVWLSPKPAGVLRQDRVGHWVNRL